MLHSVFGLRSFDDLHKKLEWEYDQLRRDPDDAYLAFNFFVTAWHLLEWRYPGKANETTVASIRNSVVLLEICEHIAVGAKHFVAEAKKHRSVSKAGFAGDAWGGAWGASWGGAWGRHLRVELEGPAAQRYGDSICVGQLADEVMAYWRAVGP